MAKFKTLASYLLIPILFILIGWFLNTAYNLPKSPNNPISQVRPTPLLKYSIENLSINEFKPSKIEVEKLIEDNPTFASYEFSFEFAPDFSNNLKSVNGLINIPKGIEPFPVIVMFRGYVNQETYVIGTGTQRAGEYFANNGFITIAPDFLGYGNSDIESSNIFESRFQTYVTAVTLLKSVNSIQNWDGTNIFIWGHSNGGQVALTTLEITGANYPTVLWAPVSKPFPYSVLYYTDESDDHGKFIRQELAKFEEDYDVEKFSLANYLDRIKAPIQLHQGTNDDAIPLAWSDTLAKSLLNLDIELIYRKHVGANHDMVPSWNQVVEESLQFFKNNLTR